MFSQKRKEYYFATGAAYCVSSALMKEMETHLRLGGNFVMALNLLKMLNRGPEKFQSFARILGTPDDMVVGFVVGKYQEQTRTIIIITSKILFSRVAVGL